MTPGITAIKKSTVDRVVPSQYSHSFLQNLTRPKSYCSAGAADYYNNTFVYASDFTAHKGGSNLLRADEVFWGWYVHDLLSNCHVPGIIYCWRFLIFPAGMLESTGTSCVCTGKSAGAWSTLTCSRGL